MSRSPSSPFFSVVAVVSFGGAYAALAYVAQEAVPTYEWLLPDEMLDGIGPAETTPGPLIQVVQFVGFLGAYRNPGPFDPLSRGSRLGEIEHPEEVTAAIEALDPPLPPYPAFEIEPRRVYAPIIDDGGNRCAEVDVN